MREADNNLRSIFLSVVGAYVRISSLNDKHCCQPFRMGLRDKTAPTLTTPLIRANMGCAVATIFSSLAFLSSSVSMANPFVAASFPNLSCLLATIFSSLRFLSNSLSSPHFNLLRVAWIYFSWFSVFLFPRLILSLSFLCSSVSDALFALSFSFLSERFFFVHAKSALVYIRNE